MSQKLTPFAYNNSEVRTITEGDQAWFVASDICDFFGVTNHNLVPCGRGIAEPMEENEGVHEISLGDVCR